MTSLILPAYNPGPAVERTWVAVRDFVRTRPEPWEVVFVCDGCTDGTGDRLGKLVGRGRLGFDVQVIDYPHNRGKGFAVRTGLLAARGDRRVFTDVDLAYPFDAVARIDDELRAGAGVAIASREHPDSVTELPPRCLGYAYRRRVQSHVFRAVARALLPVPFADTQAGLKGMTAEVAEAIVPQLRCDGFGFDCEFLTACARFGVPITEVPVRVRYADAASSTGGVRTMLRMVRELWAVRRAWPAGAVAPAMRRPTPRFVAPLAPSRAA